MDGTKSFFIADNVYLVLRFGNLHFAIRQAMNNSLTKLDFKLRFSNTSSNQNFERRLIVSAKTSFSDWLETFWADWMS